MEGACLEEPPTLSTEAICRILGYKSPVPLTAVEMAKGLRVAFYPGNTCSNKLEAFLKDLRSSLIHAGVNVVSYEEALSEGSDGRIGKGIVLFAPGEGEQGNLAIDHVASLIHNTVVAVLVGAFPGLGEGMLQRRVNTLAKAIVWHMAHLLIYVDEDSWTVCNMNGGIDTFSHNQVADRVLHTLIPKLAAPIIPPQKGDFEVRDNAFDASAPVFCTDIRDMLAGAECWGKTGLLASQTKIQELVFRNNKYRRIVAAFMSWRTGMSFGFLARQLPIGIKPALNLEHAASALQRLDWAEKDYIEVDGHLLVALKLTKGIFLVKVPDVSVLCTRSGCEKLDLDPTQDLMILSLQRGRVVIDTPVGIKGGTDCQPSFDTAAILAHAVGNAIIASVLKRVKPFSKFSLALTQKGLAIAHWHGYVDASLLPPGYHLHGEINPPVSCSTPQAAIFALSGKLSAMQKSLNANVDYLGDVHVEPTHGTNIIGESLVDLVQLVVGAMSCEALSLPSNGRRF